MPDTALLKGFVSLEKRMDEIDREEKQIKSRMKELGEVLITQFQNEGTQRIHIDGRTVYLHTRVAASPDGSREAVVDAIKASPDIAHYVAESYNATSFGAYISEVARAVEDAMATLSEGERRPMTEQDILDALPEALRPVLKVSFVHSIRSCK